MMFPDKLLAVIHTIRESGKLLRLKALIGFEP
jgi:hypothetical protein